MVPDDTGQWAFAITASPRLWHFSKENSIQKEILAPRQPHLVTASDTLQRAGAAFRQAFLQPAKRFPAPPLETGTQITHYWTTAFFGLRKAVVWKESDVSWRGLSVTPFSVRKLFVFLRVLVWLTQSSLTHTWSTVDELFMLSSARWFKIWGACVA